MADRNKPSLTQGRERQHEAATVMPAREKTDSP
jgi:hypothetical protein